jgi:hypothetical protein
MYTIFSAVLRQQRKSDVMTSLGSSARSAIYYAGSPLQISRERENGYKDYNMN